MRARYPALNWKGATFVVCSLLGAAAVVAQPKANDVISVPLLANDAEHRHLLRYRANSYFDVTISEEMAKERLSPDSLEMKVVRDTTVVEMEADRELLIQPRIAWDIMAIRQRGGRFLIREHGRHIKCPLKFRLRGPTIRATYQYPLEPGEYKFEILLRRGETVPLVVHKGVLSAHVK